MNKNIKDLAFEAGFLSAGFAKGEPVLANEKVILQFANLLINECIIVCELGNATQTTSSGAASAIKNHFGVK